MFTNRPVGVDELLESLFDNARYNVFNLVDSALAGDARRTAHILDVLQADGTAPALVIWALSRELRSLLAQVRPSGRNAPPGPRANDRRALVERALQRHGEGRLMGMLRYLARIDRVVKGQVPERREWDELQRLSLWLAGTRI